MGSPVGYLSNNNNNNLNSINNFARSISLNRNSNELLEDGLDLKNKLSLKRVAVTLISEFNP